MQTDQSGGKIITYQTTSEPAEVYRFYEDSLVKDGWGGQGFNATPQVVGDNITFEWDQLGLDGCEPLGYTLLLTAAKAGPAVTNVRIEITQTNGC